MNNGPEDPLPKPSAPDHRAGRRGSVLLQPQARSVTLRIRNLSATGLGGDLVPGMIQGEVLILTLRGIGEIGGRVAWIAGSRFGRSFDQSIDPPS